MSRRHEDRSDPAAGFRRTHIAATTGSDEATALNRHFGAVGTVRAEDEADAGFVYDAAGDDDLSIGTATLRGRRTGTLEPREHHLLVWLNDGVGSITDDHSVSVPIAIGRPVVLSASVSYTFAIDATRLTVVRIAARVVTEVARSVDDGAEEPIVFGQQDRELSDLVPVRALVGALGRSVVDPTTRAAHRADIARRLAGMLLDVFPLVDPDGRVSHRLRDAIAYIHRHAREDVSLGQIGAAVGLTGRGVQDLFQRTLQTTPITYLRDVRLNGAHDQLATSTAQTATVRDVAHEWGFRHLGRFAAAYRARFDELPAETLRASAQPPAEADRSDRADDTRRDTADA